MLLEKPQKSISNFHQIHISGYWKQEEQWETSHQAADPSKSMHEYAHYGMKGGKSIVSNKCLRTTYREPELEGNKRQ